MSSQKEKKDKILLEGAYWSLSELLRTGSGSFESLLRFNPVALKRHPEACRAVLESSYRWQSPYAERLIASGLIKKEKEEEAGDFKISVGDRGKLAALLKAHEDGGAALSDLVFKNEPPPQDEPEEGDELTASDIAQKLILVLEGFGEKVAESIGGLRVEVLSIAEGIQGTNKRISTLERQLEAALSALNGAIRTIQQVDSTKIFTSLSESTKSQVLGHLEVSEHLVNLVEEVRAVHLLSERTANDIRAREANKLDRALDDLKAVIEILADVKGPDA